MELNSNKVFETEFSVYFNEDTPYGGYDFNDSYNGYNDVIDKDTFMDIIDTGMGKVLDKIEDSEPANVIPVEFINEWVDKFAVGDNVKESIYNLVRDYREWFEYHLRKREEEDSELRDGEE